MNIVITSRLLKNSALILSLLGSSLLLSACGGGSNNKPSLNLSSKSSSSSFHSLNSSVATSSGSGTWGSIKISSNKTKTLRFEWSAPDATASYTYKLLKSENGTDNYVQVGADITETFTTIPVSVHLTDWLHNTYKIQACNDTTGCQDSEPRHIDSAMLNAITYIKASNTGTNDWFGWSVAISADGNTIAIGAPGESSNACGVNATDISNCNLSSSGTTSSSGSDGTQLSDSSPSSGAVYVFIKVDGIWQQQAYIKASNTEQPTDNPYLQLPNDRFGYQIALSADGNTLAVSAINEDSYSTGIHCYQDDYTFTLASSDYSSSASSFYSTYHVQTNFGAVYVFKRVDAQWSQQEYIKPPTDIGMMKNGAFGGSLALSGDGKTLAIGQTTDWLFSARIEPAPSSASSSCRNFSSAPPSSSSSSSSSSTTTSNSSGSASSTPGGPNSGAVYVYKLTDTGWQEESYIKAADAGRDSIGSGDEFGGSISLTDDGNLLAVGATGEDSDATTQDATIKLDGLAPDGVTIAVKDVVNPLNSGAVYVFERTDGIWSQQAKVKPSVNGWYQLFGSSVSLSGDGSTLAVGTPGDWSTSKINNTTYTYEANVSFDSSRFMYLIFPTTSSSYGTGAVYVFSRSGSTWGNEKYIKASTPMAAYQFGLAVSLSHDGNALAVGSFIESSAAAGVGGDEVDTSSTLSGAAWAFTRSGNDWTQRSYIKAPNSNMQDRFAHSLMLDGLGDTLLIGAHREASNAVGINGDETNNSADASGAVYLY